MSFYFLFAMSTKQQQLSSFGFVKLPDFDPSYFKHRTRVGFLLFLNEKYKLSYHLYTINAHTCLTSAKRAVVGEHADRAQDLKEALRNSELSDWNIYFRPKELIPELKQEILAVIHDYQSLNTNKSRVNPNEATWAYKVEHQQFKRSFTVSTNHQLTNEEAVARFLRQWRNSLDAALNRKTMPLAVYYVACEQVAHATKQWMRGDTADFSIVEIEQLAGKPRREVIKLACQANHKFTTNYRQTLAA